MSKKYGRHVRGGAPEVTKFDMLRPGTPQNKFVSSFIYGGSKLRYAVHKGVINKVRMDGVKPPYLLICNHNAFFDFYALFSK